MKAVKEIKYITDKGVLFRIGILLLPLVILYFSNVRWLVHSWYKDPNYSFGFLIPFIAGYIIYRDFGEIKNTLIVPPNLFLGIGLILSGSLIHIMSLLLNVNTASTYSLIVLLLGITYCQLGKKITKYFIFPLLYLCFMVPLSSVLIDPVNIMLKYMASHIAAGVIGFFNIPVLREGVIIHLPNSTLEIIDACSGLRSLISLLAIGAVFAYITQVGIAYKLILFIMTTPIALFVNIFRILALCFISEVYRVDVGKNEFIHNVSGMAVFFLGILVLILTEKIISRWNSDYKKA